MTRIEVAAGILSDAAGRVLIASRPPGKHLAGAYEFPGGKLHPGEAAAAALARELAEELGIRVRAATPFLMLDHDYPDRRVRLHIFRVADWDGEARALDGQDLRWVAPRDLPQAGLLAADEEIIDALLAERL